jgi:hypothetical protein
VKGPLAAHRLDASAANLAEQIVDVEQIAAVEGLDLFGTCPARPFGTCDVLFGTCDVSQAD